MKNRFLRWTKVLSIGAFSLMLLGIGVEHASAVGFPAATCRTGFREVGRLCISINAFNARRFDEAVRTCRNQRARVASYGDLYYLYRTNSSLAATYNPNGKWLGPDLAYDDEALCGSRSITSSSDGDISNFENECSKFDSRAFWCAHDHE